MQKQNPSPLLFFFEREIRCFHAHTHQFYCFTKYKHYYPNSNGAKFHLQFRTDKNSACRRMEWTTRKKVLAVVATGKPSRPRKPRRVRGGSPDRLDSASARSRPPAPAMQEKATPARKAAEPIKAAPPPRHPRTAPRASRDNQPNHHQATSFLRLRVPLFSLHRSRRGGVASEAGGAGLGTSAAAGSLAGGELVWV